MTAKCRCPGITYKMCQSTVPGYSFRQNRISKGFDHLPEEMVFKIFKYLPHDGVKACALVCRRWNRIAYDSRLGLWTSMAISRNSSHGELPMDIVATAVVNGVDRIYVQLAKFTMPVPMEAFPESSLTSLSLWMSDIPPEWLTLIISSSLQLTSVKLEDVVVVNRKVCDAIASLPKLEYLYLKNCHEIRSEEVIALKPAFKRANFLFFRGTPMLDTDLDHLVSALNPDLGTLCLSGAPGALQDRHAVQIVSTCKELRVLFLWNGKFSAEVEDAMVKANVKHITFSAIERFQSSSVVRSEIERMSGPRSPVPSTSCPHSPIARMPNLNGMKSRNLVKMVPSSCGPILSVKLV